MLDAKPLKMVFLTTPARPARPKNNAFWLLLLLFDDILTISFPENQSLFSQYIITKRKKTREKGHKAQKEEFFSLIPT